LKIIFREAESEGLRAWLASNPDPIQASSEIVRTEVGRACRKLGPDSAEDGLGLVASLSLIPVTRDVLDSAVGAEPLSVRSLDAIHLASAMSIQVELAAFVAYDRRLQAAAQQLGLPLVAPA
jgi:uncharacterized protein